MAYFEMGNCTVSPLAQEQIAKLNVSADEFFARHQRGDWGAVSERVADENRIAASKEKSLLAITSRHQVSPEIELLIITATDRSHTHLQLASEYAVREVSSQEGYAAWAATYDTVPNLLINAEAPAFEELLNHLPPLSTAVDVGTGTGRHALELARRGMEVVGYDESAEMLAVARSNAATEKLSNVQFEQASVGTESLPTASNRFDLLTCSLMLCHLPDLKAAAKECVRTVRPGGYLLISDFHPDSIAFGFRSAFPTPTTHYLFPNTANSRQDYLDALTETGCTILEVRDLAVDGQPYGNVSPEAQQAKGMPPFCLIILAQKRV
ncbi:MAG: class I SAM-dependent methyltransferase [Caldilineaceae bacterium]